VSEHIKTPAEQRQDIEASYFAMRLLVPDHLLAKEDFTDFDWTNDKHIKTLARKYQVPIGVMMIRIHEFCSRAHK
jgi:Zn-dependent peptidase ImmA (M78 family)